jgi:ABC-2 type transport system ATP-binding protein
MIELQNVTKLYKTVIGLNDVTVSLSRRAYGLLGPNGSGKSTMLNLITGQLRPTMGEVHTLGLCPWNNRELRRRIGVCPEHDLSYTNVVAVDWLTYLLKLHGFGRRDARRRAEEALARVQLGDFMSRPLGSFSRGMRQKVKLAQAFAHNPDLLILDEPFKGLDPVGRRLIKEMLMQWLRDGKGLIIASHILHDVESITQSFLLICGGRLLASGSAAEIHSLLADVPNEIYVRCSNATGLAQAMLRAGVVDSLRFGDRGEELVIGTCSPVAVYEHLPEWTAEVGARIYELRCADDSLQTLFHSLLRIHRGKV